MALSNVRLVSDGLPTGTVVTVNGEPIDGVLSVQWKMRDNTSIGVLTLTIEGVEADVEAIAVKIDGPR